MIRALFFRKSFTDFEHVRFAVLGVKARFASGNKTIKLSDDSNSFIVKMAVYLRKLKMKPPIGTFW